MSDLELTDSSGVTVFRGRQSPEPAVQAVTTTVTSAQLLAAFDTPPVLVPGTPGKAIIPIAVTGSSAGGVAYTLQSTAGVTSGLTVFGLDGMNALFIAELPLIALMQIEGGGAAAPASALTGEGLTLFVEDANPEAGDFAMTFTTTYLLVG